MVSNSSPTALKLFIIYYSEGTFFRLEAKSSIGSIFNDKSNRGLKTLNSLKIPTYLSKKLKLFSKSQSG